MNRSLKYIIALCLCTLFTAGGSAAAAEIHVAVASNFTHTLNELAKRFTHKTGVKIIIISGSTGKHYAQIINGAPFDIFLAADSERPLRLDAEGHIIPATRFIYAIGKLVLWSPNQTDIDSKGDILLNDDINHIAIANPRLAPYGRAAQETLTQLKLWTRLQSRFVRGENIGQTFQFVNSGNAQLGFVALSQVKRPGHKPRGSRWEIPQTLYTPIEQQAVLLRESDAGRKFIAYLQTEESLSIIRDYGYGTP